MALEQPRFEDLPALTIAGLGHSYTRDTLGGIPVQWSKLTTQLQFVSGRVGLHTYGVWYDVLGGGGQMRYVAGVRVGEFAPVHPGFGLYLVPAQHYAVFRHAGGLDQIRRTVDEIFSQWLPGSGRKHHRQDENAPDFLERYTEAAEGGKPGMVEILVPIQK